MIIITSFVVYNNISDDHGYDDDHGDQIMVVMIVIVSQVFFALPAITTRSYAVAYFKITIMMMIDDDGDHI